MKPNFEPLYKTTQIPVIVAETGAGFPVVYCNASARLALNPLLTTDQLKEDLQIVELKDLLIFQPEDGFLALIDMILKTGSIFEYPAEIIAHGGKMVSASISANVAEIDGALYIILYVRLINELEHKLTNANNVLSSAFFIALHEQSMDTAIDEIMRFVGLRAQVSRVYIFEEISAEYTRNTYEWCAEGTEPAIQDLQYLKKTDYNYDVIVNGGMYITDDIRDLPENDREILDMQGIKSLAILPLIHLGTPLGYIGFDDCEKYRKWSSEEIQMLESVASIILSLLLRRNSETKARRSQDILQIISDNMDNIIYVSNVETGEMIFVNKTLERELNRPAEEIIGEKCWEVIQNRSDGKCPFCPADRLTERSEAQFGKRDSWEIFYESTGKWYLVNDVIIEWIDGSNVNLVTATEITDQINYQEKLKQIASMDTMTDTFNREWGYQTMRDFRASPSDEDLDISLVFLDLDGLKHVNDTLGHPVGDDMIITTLEVIRSCIRKSDHIIRWGGDEFLLLLRCDLPAAERIMKNVTRRVEEYNEKGEKPYKLSFSYGITDLLEEEESVDAIVNKADQMMYENKMKKRGRAR